ncbi:MAG: exo-beta-N-acetylmuramidase NamZ domain-containing protein, partial [Bacteroidia bacterium]
MFKPILFLFLFFSSSLLFAQYEAKLLKPSDIKTGAEQMETYLPQLKGKRVAIIANPTTLVGQTHLVDTLLALKVNIKKIFSPEHGFRGIADAGEKVGNNKDAKTGLLIVSLYGKHMKPTAEDLKDVDVLIYDIQDVGVRFYTYISTMSYCMEAAAENKKEMLVLDRPNPNGYYIDGPVLDPKWKSFLGLHPVPLVYGMTYGEYAKMVNGEGWLQKGIKCKLKVIPVIGYTHLDTYELPVKPSPNLPNMTAIYLYPTLGLFEGTIMSVGRGTDFPFQVIGHPDMKRFTFTFTPAPNVGAKSPKYEGQVCKGFDLREFGAEYVKSARQIYLFWLLGTYNDLKRPDYFDENFNYHAG